ncbi:inorganic pyrophosphatase-like [Pollicipes pollicipes]|uniref:inorganic pyrophosphatase-like n=1 Tax=Pollicipes pollicipes TaxID=41117 RepID=UPI001884EE8F|nr:inorganic pyrophosphatase-like [Pollicipes pollicipes]
MLPRLVSSFGSAAGVWGRGAFGIVLQQLVHVARAGSPLSTMAGVTFEERGTPNSEDYRIYYRNADGPISPFHDIPLYADAEKKVFNMVVEVPRWTNAKMEIATGERLNPIKQDTKKGNLRYVANVFPHHGYIWNYGALPQTWENPHVTDESTGFMGDNDPIDVCELGSKVCRRGEVLQVKVLGVLAMIDEGETDWKLLAINVDDPLAEQLNDVADVEKLMPGYLSATVEWLRLYKVPDGKPENKFAFNGEAKDREFAHSVISDTADHWRELVTGKADAGGLDIHAVTVDDAQMKLEKDEAEAVLAGAPTLHPPAPLDNSAVNKVSFLSNSN